MPLLPNLVAVPNKVIRWAGAATPSHLEKGNALSNIKPSKAVKPLLDEAKESGLTVEYRKGTWVIVAPGTGLPPVFLGNNVDAPRSINNIRAAIRRMAKALPATTSNPAPAAPEWTMPDTWSIPDLIAYARQQGIDVQPTDGGLRIAAPANGHAQAIAQVLRTHETAVRNALENPRMHHPATVEIDTADLFYDDAYAVWECVRDEAKAQGDKPAPLYNGLPGVLWAGARDNALAALSPEWQPSYRAALARFLAACGAVTAVRRGRSPIWRIAAEWPEREARQVRMSSLRHAVTDEPETETEVKVELKPDADLPAPAPDSPLAMLARIKARVDQAEQSAAEWQDKAENAIERAHKAERRADEAEAALHRAEGRIAELEVENADLAAQLDQVAPQLDELNAIKAAFRDLTGGSR